MPETQAAPAAAGSWRHPLVAVLATSGASVVGAVLGAATYTRVEAPYWETRAEAVLPLCALAALNLVVYLLCRPRIGARLRPAAAIAATLAWVAIFVGALSPAELLGPPEHRRDLEAGPVQWLMVVQYWGVPQVVAVALPLLGLLDFPAVRDADVQG